MTRSENWNEVASAAVRRHAAEVTIAARQHHALALLFTRVTTALVVGASQR